MTISLKFLFIVYSFLHDILNARFIDLQETPQRNMNAVLRFDMHLVVTEIVKHSIGFPFIMYSTVTLMCIRQLKHMLASHIYFPWYLVARNQLKCQTSFRNLVANPAKCITGLIDHGENAHLMSHRCCCIWTLCKPLRFHVLTMWKNGEQRFLNNTIPCKTTCD